MEKVLKKRNGSNWREAHVLNLDMTGISNDRVFGTLIQLEELLKQLKGPQILILSTEKVILDKLVSILMKDSMSNLQKSVTRLFLGHMIVNPNLLRDFIGSLVNLQEIQFSSLDDSKWFTLCKKLGNLRKISIQKLLSKNLQNVGFILRRIDSLVDLSIDITTQLNKSFGTFLEEIGLSIPLLYLRLAVHSPFQYETPKTIPQETQISFQESATLFQKMSNLSSLHLCLDNTSDTTLQFLKTVILIPSIQTLFVSVSNATFEQLHSVFDAFKLSQASHITLKCDYFSSSLNSLSLPLPFLNSFASCSNLITLGIQLSSQNQQQCLTYLYKICKKLVNLECLQ